MWRCCGSPAIQDDGARGWACALRLELWTELESQLQRAVKVSAKSKHVKCKMDLERCLFWDPPATACRAPRSSRRRARSRPPPRKGLLEDDQVVDDALLHPPQHVLSSQGSWKLTLLRPLVRWRRSVSTSVLEFLYLGAVPLGVKEAGLVRSCRMGPPVSQHGLHLLPDPLRHLLLREVRRVPRAPPSSFTGSQSLRL